MVLHALYRRYSVRAARATSDLLPRVFLEHAAEQRAIIDRLAELVHDLGEMAVADPRDAAELTSIERPTCEAEDLLAVLHRLMRAHEAVLARVREAIARSDAVRDWATGDVLGEVLRGNELQAWILAAHLADIGQAPSATMLRHSRARGPAPCPARG